MKSTNYRYPPRSINKQMTEWHHVSSLTWVKVIAHRFFSHVKKWIRPHVVSITFTHCLRNFRPSCRGDAVCFQIWYKYGVTFPHAWGIRPITTHWLAGQSKHTVLFRTIDIINTMSMFRTMSFVKIDVFQKGKHVERGERSKKFPRVLKHV